MRLAVLARLRLRLAARTIASAMKQHAWREVRRRANLGTTKMLRCVDSFRNGGFDGCVQGAIADQLESLYQTSENTQSKTKSSAWNRLPTHVYTRVPTGGMVKNHDQD